MELYCCVVTSPCEARKHPWPRNDVETAEPEEHLPRPGHLVSSEWILSRKFGRKIGVFKFHQLEFRGVLVSLQTCLARHHPLPHLVLHLDLSLKGDPGSEDCMFIHRIVNNILMHLFISNMNSCCFLKLSSIVFPSMPPILIFTIICSSLLNINSLSVFSRSAR